MIKGGQALAALSPFAVRRPTDSLRAWEKAGSVPRRHRRESPGMNRSMAVLSTPCPPVPIAQPFALRPRQSRNIPHQCFGTESLDPES